MAEQTFTAGQVLTAAQMTTLQANTGLNFISNTTVGTSVASVSVTGCFSSLYDNYKVIYEGGTGSAVGMSVQMPATTTGYSYAAVYQQYNATTPLGVGAVNTSGWANVGRGSSTGNSCDFDIYRPFTATATGIRWGSTDYNASTGFVLTGSGVLDNTSSYTGFAIIPASGTISGGTITVYGYRK